MSAIERGIIFQKLRTPVPFEEVFRLIENVKERLESPMVQWSFLREACRHYSFEEINRLFFLFLNENSQAVCQAIFLQGIVEHHRKDLFERFYRENELMFSGDFCERFLPQCCDHCSTEILEKIFSLHRSYLLSFDGYLERLFIRTVPLHVTQGRTEEEFLKTLQRLIELTEDEDITEALVATFIQACAGQRDLISSYLAENYREILEKDSRSKELLARFLV